jgi:hypothetical protein
MAESFAEALKGIIEECIEWKNAPKEAEDLLRLFSGSGRDVLFKSRAGYINSQKTLDRPAGTLFITDSHLLFLARPNGNFFLTTKWVKIPLRSITRTTCTKYRAGHRISAVSGGREYSFMLQNGLWFSSKEEHEAAMKILIDAQRNALSNG